MEVACPRCSRRIAAEDVNVGKDLALCRACDQAFPLSEIVESAGTLEEVDTDNPPRGAWYSFDGDSIRIGSTTRHPIALFLVPFTCLWSGGSLGGIYGTQIVHHRFNPVFSLFGIPFLLGSVVLGAVTLLALFGKVEVRLNPAESEVFTGIGPLGKRRRFRSAEVRQVKEEMTASGRSTQKLIVMEGEDMRSIRFGSMMNDERRRFVLGALRAALVNQTRRF
jgi:hypothetical protein